MDTGEETRVGHQGEYNMKKEPMMHIKDKKMTLNLPVTYEAIHWVDREARPIITQPIGIPQFGKPFVEISEHNDGPRCSIEQVKHYRENQEKILPPEILRSVRKHKDVMHGGRSVNMLLPKKYERKSKDFDIYSKQPRPRAKEIEDYIDKRCGCDMAHVKSMNVPNVSGIEDELMSADIHKVITKISSDGEVDYMTLPKNLPTIYSRGIRHEKLEEALRKAKRGLTQPMRMAKASKDIARINAYLHSRGRL